MGLYYDKEKNRWIIRIRRKSGSVTRTLGDGVTKAQAYELYRQIERDFVDKELNKTVAIATVWERMIQDEFPKLRKPENYRFTMRTLAPYVMGRNVEALSEIAQRVSVDGKWRVSTRNRLVSFLGRTARLSNLWFGTPVVRMPVAGKAIPREIYFTREEVSNMVVRALVSVDVSLSRSILVAAYTGLRQGEILALRPSDIRGNEIHVRMSKTGRPRKVPFPEFIRNDLMAFISGEKKPRNWYTRNFRKVLKEMNMEGHFHDLRHTYASWLIQDGVSIYTVGQLLGHTSVTTTQRYSHLSTESLHQAIRGLG